MVTVGKESHPVLRHGTAGSALLSDGLNLLYSQSYLLAMFEINILIVIVAALYKGSYFTELSYIINK